MKIVLLIVASSTLASSPPSLLYHGHLATSNQVIRKDNELQLVYRYTARHFNILSNINFLKHKFSLLNILGDRVAVQMS